MKQNETQYHWCPLARVAVQQSRQGGGVETLPVAYNRSSMHPDPMEDPLLTNAARCLGPDCACWQPSPWNWLKFVPILGYFFKRRGRCGLAVR
jgi:hypothetical protein